MLAPARAARLATRLRAVVGGLQRRMAPPPVRILEDVLGGLDLAALAAICRIGLPERLTGPVTTEQLAATLDVDAGRLDRLVRYADAKGWLRRDRRGLVRPTRLTDFLRPDHPGGWRAWVEFVAGTETTAAIGMLDAALQADGDAFRMANGVPFFAWMQQHGDRHAVFDRAMDAGGRMHGLVLARTVDWSRARRVCDVGGGTGALLGVLLAEQPHLDGVLLDLPEVVARAPTRKRMTAMGGDAFVAVPPGCDTYLFVNVLHDWDDDDAVRLLRRASEALRATDPGSPAGRVVVVEHEARERPRDDLVTRTDLLMLALTPGGRERSTREFGRLGAIAGLRLTRSTHLTSGDRAHIFHIAASSGLSPVRPQLRERARARP